MSEEELALLKGILINRGATEIYEVKDVDAITVVVNGMLENEFWIADSIIEDFIEDYRLINLKHKPDFLDKLKEGGVEANCVYRELRN